MEESEGERARRIGLNEAVFREINERIRAIHESVAGDEQEQQIICECGNADCAERITIAPAAYEALRAESDRFGVIPGHEQPDFEDILERHAGFFIVSKCAGLPREIAVSTDPRS